MKWTLQDRKSPYYMPNLVGSGFRVEVDGVPIRRVYAGDEREGWVDAHLEDENGQCFLDESGNEIASKRVFGKVVILPPDVAPVAEFDGGPRRTSSEDARFR